MKLPRLSLPIMRKVSQQHLSKFAIGTSRYALIQSGELVTVDAKDVVQQANILALQKKKDDTPSWKCTCGSGSGTCNVTVDNIGGGLLCSSGTCDSCSWKVELPGVFELPDRVFGRII